MKTITAKQLCKHIEKFLLGNQCDFEIFDDENGKILIPRNTKVTKKHIKNYIKAFITDIENL